MDCCKKTCDLWVVGADFERVVDRYRPLISKYRNFPMFGLGPEDVEQESLIVLWNAHRRWGEYQRRRVQYTVGAGPCPHHRGSRFLSYLMQALQWRLLTLQRVGNLKHRPATYFSELEETAGFGAVGATTTDDTAVDCQRFLSSLSDEERQYVVRKVSGYGVKPLSEQRQHKLEKRAEEVFAI